MQKNVKGSKVLVIEEASLQSLEDIYEINRLAQYMMNTYDIPFGGLHVVILGDFYQMKTMSGIPIVQEDLGNNMEARLAKEIFTNI